MPSVLRDIRGAGMQNLIYPRLPRAEQRVVPTVLGFFYKTNPFNASMLSRMDDYCVTSAEKYISWAAQDPRLVALFPFYYSGGYADNMVGLGELPRCLARWVEFGRSVVHGAKAVGSGGSGGEGFAAPPATRVKRTCPSPKEKVKHQWCRKDL